MELFGGDLLVDLVGYLMGYWCGFWVYLGGCWSGGFGIVFF